MAEVASKERQQAKTYKPSRLRNELCPESVDDGKCDGYHSEQKHLTNTLFPHVSISGQRQSGDYDEDLDSKSDYGEVVPLSPKSAALLERNTVTQPTKKGAPTPIIVKLLSKEACGLDDIPDPSPSFFFRQTRRITGRTPPQLEPKAPQSTIGANLTNAALEHACCHRFGERKVPVLDSPPIASEHAQQGFPDTNYPQRTGQHSPLLHATATSPLESTTVQTEPELPSLVAYRPFSTQPVARPMYGIVKDATAKMDEKSKRAALLQQRAESQPLQSLYSICQPNQASATVQSLSNISASSNDLLPTSRGSVEEGARASSVSYDYSKNVQAKHQAVKNNGSQHRVDASHVKQNTSQSNPSSLIAIASQPVFRVHMKQSSTGSCDQLSKIEAAPPTGFKCEDSSKAEKNALFGRQSMFPPLQASREPLQLINDALEAESETLNQRDQSNIESNGQQKPTSPSAASNAVLHKNAGEDEGCRVNKSQQRRRTASRRIAQFHHDPSISPGIERSLETLRIALLADHFRVQHENKTSKKHQDETLCILKDLVESQKDTIAEWKGRHQSLLNTISRLTERAKTNQRYVTGLQKDYEKLQRSVALFHDKNKKTLEANIAEVENEKLSLRREFHVTLDVLAKSQKTLKATVDDLYSRLIFCESKKRDFAKDLESQTAMYQDERKKRDFLEHQLLSTVQSTQGELRNTSKALISRLEALQSSENRFKGDEGHGTGIKECLVVLRNLQATPFVTIKDFQTAEGMFRFMRESVHSRLDTLAEALDSKCYLTDKVQTFFKNQMHSFSTDILKHEEMLAENHKMLEVNTTLRNQLEVQQKHCQVLDGQVQALQQSEVDMKAHSTELERQLNDLKKTGCEHAIEPFGHASEVDAMREQLRKAVDDLKLANSRAEQTERIQEQHEAEVAKYKNWYETCKGKLLEISGQTKLETKIESAAESREEIAREYKRNFNEQESILKNKIHYLTNECDKKEEEIQGYKKEEQAAKEQLQNLRKSVQALTTELKIMRKEKELIKAKRMIAQGSPTNAPEPTGNKERLRQRSEELYAEIENNEAQNQKYLESNNNMADFHASDGESQTQISRHLLIVENMRQESNDEPAEAPQQAQIADQLVQGQNLIVQKDKERLLLELKHARSNVTNLSSVQAQLRMEGETLQRVEAQIQASQQDPSHPTPNGGSSSSSLHDAPAETKRKKVHRQNLSVLNMIESSSAQQDTSECTSFIRQAEALSAEHQDSSVSLDLAREAFLNIPAAEEPLGGTGFAVEDFSRDSSHKSQVIRGKCISVEDTKEELSHGSRHDTTRPSSSSTDFTTISSDMLTQLAIVEQRKSTPMRPEHGRNSTGQSSSNVSFRDSLLHPSTVSLPQTDSLHLCDKLKISVNTAPYSTLRSGKNYLPEADSIRLSPSFQLHESAGNAHVQRSKQENLGFPLSGRDGTSSPDFMQALPATLKQTYGDQDSRVYGREDYGQPILKDTGHDRLAKRKSAVNQTEQKMLTKRQRTSSRADMHYATSECTNESPYSSKQSPLVSQPKIQLVPSSRHDLCSSQSLKKNQPDSSVVLPRAPSHVPSLSNMCPPQSEQKLSSFVSAAGSTRRTSSRLSKKQG